MSLRKVSLALIVGAALVGCANLDERGNGMLGGAVGGASGAAIGGELGGREGAVVGAGVGAAAGAALGQRASVHRVEASEKKKMKTTQNMATVTAANTKTIKSALSALSRSRGCVDWR